MYLLPHLLQACYISLVMSSIDGYLLFAANLDDFRSVAKKFIPNKLADKLVELVSESSLGQKSDNSRINKDDDYEYYEEGEERNLQRDQMTPLTSTTDSHDYVEITPSITYKNREQISSVNIHTTATEIYDNESTPRLRNKNNKPISQVDIDEIVERVKEKLKNDFEFKPHSKQGKWNQIKESQREGRDYEYTEDTTIKETDNIKQRNPYLKKSGMEKRPDRQSEIESTSKQTKAKPIKHIQKDEEETVTEKVEDDGGLFEIIKTKTNDSYEDYVMPKKEANIFSSEESTTERPTKTTIKRVKTQLSTDLTEIEAYTPRIKKIKKSTTPDYDETTVTTKPDEIKARTENLWIDDNEEKNDSVNDTRIIKGTNIPTLFRYKMSSPNYLAKIPIIAEKYNFNEPIPEKDRLRENLKPVGNPQAKINHKVRLN